MTAWIVPPARRHTAGSSLPLATRPPIPRLRPNRLRSPPCRHPPRHGAGAAAEPVHRSGPRARPRRCKVKVNILFTPAGPGRDRPSPVEHASRSVANRDARSASSREPNHPAGHGPRAASEVDIGHEVRGGASPARRRDSLARPTEPVGSRPSRRTPPPGASPRRPPGPPSVANARRRCTRQRHPALTPSHARTPSQPSSERGGQATIAPGPIPGSAADGTACLGPTSSLRGRPRFSRPTVFFADPLRTVDRHRRDRLPKPLHESDVARAR